MGNDEKLVTDEIIGYLIRNKIKVKVITKSRNNFLVKILDKNFRGHNGAGNWVNLCENRCYYFDKKEVFLNIGFVSIYDGG